jgi:beta-barrel assembly-enhancing protease
MKLILPYFKHCLAFGMIVLMTGCSKNDTNIPITIFSVSDDITLGNQIDQEILKDPGQYPILDSVQYASAYAHLYSIRNTILASGKLQYANLFKWKCRIIHNDSVINAFCVPGGNIYIYSGIIKFLDNEAEFAGVLGHEMAHADLRHTSQQLTVVYGETFLLNLILGNNPSQLSQIVSDLALGLGNLAYSRQHEYQSDEYSVKYLYPTKYDAAGIGDFFVKIQAQPSPPAFLSDHPSPSDRLTKITEVFNSLGGVHGEKFITEYQQFKSLLP